MRVLEGTRLLDICIIIHLICYTNRRFVSDHEDEGERRIDMHAHSHLSAQENMYRLGLLILPGLRFRDLGGLIGMSGVRFMVSVRIRCRVRVRVRVTYPRRLA